MKNLGKVVVVEKTDVGRDLRDLHRGGADQLLGHGDALAADVVSDGGIEVRVEQLIQLRAGDGKVRAQVLDGQIPGDVVVDVFFDLLRRVETADLEHPLVIDMADAGVEDAAGRLDVRGRIVPVLVVELAAGLLADAELGGVGGDGVKFLLRAVGHHADADKRDDDAFIIQGCEILREPRMTSVEQGLARAAADLHVRRVAAVAAALF